MLLKIGVELKTKPTVKGETPESQDHRLDGSYPATQKGYKK